MRWLNKSIQKPMLIFSGCFAEKPMIFLDRGLLTPELCHWRVPELCSHYQPVLLLFPTRRICSEGWGLFRKLLPVLRCLCFLGAEGGTTAAITSLLHTVRKDMKQQVFKVVLISSVVSERLWEPPWMSKAILCWRVRKGFTYWNLFCWELCFHGCSPETSAL